METKEAYSLETIIGWAERNAKACAPDADVAFVAGNADLWQQTADMLKTCRPPDFAPSK